MKNSKFVEKVYFSVVQGDLLRFSCLSNSLQFKVRSDRPYFFELSVYELENPELLQPSGELSSEDPSSEDKVRVSKP